MDEDIVALFHKFETELLHPESLLDRLASTEQVLDVDKLTQGPCVLIVLIFEGVCVCACGEYQRCYVDLHDLKGREKTWNSL